MTDDYHTQLSELLDGELDETRLDECIRRLSGDESSRGRFTRYVMVRDCLRHSPPGPASVGLSDRVRVALQDEPVVLSPSAQRHRAAKLLRPAAGLAIAASVATVAVLGLRDGQMTEQESRTASPVATETSRDRESTVPAADGPGASPFQYAEAQLQAPAAQAASVSDRAWMNNYLLRHNEAAGATGRTGFIPYVYIVTREPTRQASDDAVRRTPVDARPD